MPTYTVGGFITGPKLPRDFMTIARGEVRLRRPGERFPRGRPQHPRMTIVDDQDQPVDQFQVSPGDLTVHSSWIVRFTVQADDPDSALEDVREILLPPILAALEALGGEPYRVELVRIVDHAPEGESESPPTDWAFGGVEEPSFMTDEDQRAAVDMARTAESDAVARETAELLEQSLQLSDFAAGHTRSLKAAVLGVFQVIERIAQEVAKRAPLEVDEERQRTVVDHLKRALGKNRRTKADATSIKKAATELNEIAGSTSDAQIVRAGEVLGADAQAVAVGRELRRFRNERLGHPGQRVSARELARWLGPNKGRSAAAHFWHRYVTWVAAGRPVEDRNNPGT